MCTVSSQPKSDRSVELLHALCSCEGRPIGSNQDSVCATLFGEAKDKLLISVRTSNDVIMVQPSVDFFDSPTTPEQRWITMESFALRSSPEYFAYFLAFVRLCAETCLGRNTSSLERVAGAFPKDTIMRLAAIADNPTAIVRATLT